MVEAIVRSVPVLSKRSIPRVGARQYTLQMNVLDLPSGFPLRANPRTPEDSARDVKSMVKTLLEAQGKFIDFNSSIAAVAECFLGTQIIQGELHVGFEVNEKTQGIVNGGHTHLAIQIGKERAEKARVVLNDEVAISITIGLPSSLLPDVSRFKNRNNLVKERLFTNKEGKFSMDGEKACRTALRGWFWGQGEVH